MSVRAYLTQKDVAARRAAVDASLGAAVHHQCCRVDTGSIEKVGNADSDSKDQQPARSDCHERPAVTLVVRKITCARRKQGDEGKCSNYL